MQIPIISGIYTDGNADFRTSYPVNMMPVPKPQGISAGYLRPADGIVRLGDAGPGVDRGAIAWKGICYRVMGTKLVSISSDGAMTTLGDVGGSGQVSLDYSFDRIAIASGNRLYYWSGSLTQVTDPDIGNVLDVVWMDGYFITTDGEFIVVTELNDPTAVDPLKYGSSEVDPDPIVGLLEIQGELYVINRHTIEVFDNVGGDGFPFQRIEGAQISKGAIGTHCFCMISDTVAFLGSGRNEAPGVYLGINGSARKVSTREIDQILLGYTEDQLAKTVVESRIDKNHQHLLIHLVDRCLVYDVAASEALRDQVWFTLTSSDAGFSTYRGRNAVWVYDKWLVGDTASANHGYLSSEIASHYGDTVRWEFATQIVYNEGRGALFHDLELVALAGRSAFGESPTLSTSYSIDGETWSVDRYIKAGALGQRNKRLVWFQQGFMRNFRMQRFRGNSDAFLSVARLEANLEALSY